MTGNKAKKSSILKFRFGGVLLAVLIVSAVTIAITYRRRYPASNTAEKSRTLRFSVQPCAQAIL
jgi:hypothetical protein